GFIHAISNVYSTSATLAETYIHNNTFNIKNLSNDNQAPETVAIAVGLPSYHANANFIRNNTILFRGANTAMTASTPILINSSSLTVHNNLFVNTNSAANTGVATRVHNTGAIDFKNNSYVGFSTLLYAN